MSTIPTIELNDGVEIPQLGFGTYQVSPAEATEVVGRALDVGYRHIDTAQMYGNEAEVGAAVRASGIDRGEVFVTSKLNNGFHDYDDALTAFDESIARLDIGYLDLFLIHWPLPTVSDYVTTWKAMEQMKATGKVRSIGVSNFEPEHLRRLFDETDTVPSVNQVEAHPYFAQPALRAFDRDHQIATEAWSPIARGDVLDDPVIVELAAEVGRTPAQVTLRWHIQRGAIVIPKTTHPDRMRENFGLFDFGLDPDAMRRIDGLDRGRTGRRGPDPKTFDLIPS